MTKFKTSIMILFFGLILVSCCFAQSQDLARYTPLWIRDGFATGGTTHEPWFYQIRRNRPDFNLWQREAFDERISEEYIKSLAKAGVTVFHLYFYKGFGFEAEKAHMDEAARVIKIAHKYGLKADTYIQWNTLAYETFFVDVPEAESDKWYQIDETGKPIMLPYGGQQSFRFRPCFNHDGYMDYYKERILRYAVEKADTDFIHFDNFDLNPPPDFCHNPATIEAFRRYLEEKYTLERRRNRFGFEDLSQVRPPIWNKWNPPEQLEAINDPVMQEWTDFRAWTMVTRLSECARFVRELKKEVVIEVNPHGLLGDNRIWLRAINHPDLMQYTNVIWTEDRNNPRWENGVAIGKFRHYKLGRTTKNFILTYNGTARDFGENLSLNRTIADLPSGVPVGVARTHLDFWNQYRDLYTNAKGVERVAVLRSYPSIAYNNLAVHNAVNMAEQALQQRQIPFDIIFDQQLDRLDRYSVLVLANQESLSEHVLAEITHFVEAGGGIVATGDTGRYDEWRRVRQVHGLENIFGPQPRLGSLPKMAGVRGKGRAVYLPQLTLPADIELDPRVWKMPVNADEFEAAVLWVSPEPLPLRVDAPEWIGVSHDRQSSRDIVHLFNYREEPVAGILLHYRGKVSNAWAVSPQREGSRSLSLEKQSDETQIRIPVMKAYEIVVLER
jgi:hypothetical protein